jgi:hypothetical protein
VLCSRLRCLQLCLGAFQFSFRLGQTRLERRDQC